MDRDEWHVSAFIRGSAYNTHRARRCKDDLRRSRNASPGPDARGGGTVGGGLYGHRLACRQPLPKVRPDTRRAVEKAIARLGYVPNRAARSLVTKRTDTIALVVSESERRVFSDPFFPAIVQGISTAIADTELQLLLLLARGEREHVKVERYIRHGHVDGVILMSLHGEDPLPRALTDAGIPTVLSGRPRPGELPYVDADNRGGARAATSHLLSAGRARSRPSPGRWT